ncbi:MAG: 1-deoxy-D-xylulose-5-phosphate reductoisomerase [Simkaniaceae bacterium]
MLKPAKNMVILGSTGSVGRQTLQVASHLGLNVIGLAAYSDEKMLNYQAHLCGAKKKVLYQKEGMNALIDLVEDVEVDTVVVAFGGVLALTPTFHAAKSGKRIALATKEVLVSAGELIMDTAGKNGAHILPVDSEHSAIFQCLMAGDEVNRLILTASGGPFWKHSLEELNQVRLEEALKHPKWSMGPKITIDSSTMMNKGLEVIEAHYLFDIPVEKIEVVIHPESLIHSLVEFVDNAMIAQVSYPDMQLPIQYALTYPKRLKGLLKPFDFTTSHQLSFHPPDSVRFPCLNICYNALEIGESLPCFLNAANESIVHGFLNGKIEWNEIPIRLEKMMEKHTVIKNPSLTDLLNIEKEARRQVEMSL